MLSYNTSVERTPAISPAQLANLLPSRPLLSSDEGFWRNVVLQHYRHPPSCVSVPPLQDHLLVVHLSGAVLIEENRARGRVERRWADSGQMSLTPAGQGITRVLKGRPEVLLVCLPPHFVRELAEEINFGAANGELVPRLAVADQVVYRLGRLLLDEASGEAPARLMVETLTRALAIRLLQSHSSAAPRRPEAPICMPRGGKLRRVIEYMRTHMDESLSLSQLANLSGLSPSQFTRSFRAAMGKPPHSYLIDLRIEKARDLLERTDLPVIEVGMQCGFAQPNHFATTFRKVVGLAPRAWRVARRA
jgi:AraC family transcriptional regulator